MNTYQVLSAALLFLSPLAGIPQGRADLISDWNQTGEDHLSQNAGNQLERGLAMMHLAQFEAINAVVGKYRPYTLAISAPAASAPAAAVEAAYGVLTNLSRANLATLNAARQKSLGTIANGPEKDQGLVLGKLAADMVVALRAADDLDLKVTAPSSSAVGRWRPTPPASAPGVSAELRYVTPFTMTALAQFRQGPPPALTSAEYAADYNEVRLMGSRTSTTRTADQTAAARFYESVGYSDVWKGVLAGRSLTLIESARLFAITHMVGFDAQASVCATKYAYGFWRPVTAIRNGDKDGNDSTPGDPAWTSFFDTHPHPDYPSQASQILGAWVEVLISVLGDDFAFTITPADGTKPRSFSRLSVIFDDVVTGRIAAGMHFRNSCVVAVDAGRKIARHALATVLQPLPLLAAGQAPGVLPFQLSLDRGGVHNHVIETSADLFQWLPWQTNSYGVVVLTDPEASTLGHRFYRVRELP